MKTIIQICARNVLRTKNNVMASSTAKLSSILPDSVKKGFTDVSHVLLHILFYCECFVLIRGCIGTERDKVYIYLIAWNSSYIGG